MALIQSLEELQAIRDAQNGVTASRGSSAVSGVSRPDSPIYGTYTEETAASFAETLRQKSEESVKAVKYDDIFSLASRTYGISKNLLLAVAETESNFDATAVSHAGAQGVMQLMPATARYLGVDNALDPYQNIMGGAKLLRDNIRQFGSIPLALAAYNAGPDAVQKYGGVPPYKETQNYVTKIMGMLGSGAYKTSNDYLYSGSAESSADKGVYLDTAGSSRSDSGSSSDSGEMVHLLLSDYNSLLSSLLLSSVGSSLSTGLLGNSLSGLSGTSSLLGSSLSSSLLDGLSANNYSTYNLFNTLSAESYAKLRNISNAVGTLPDADAGTEEGDAATLSAENAAAAGSAATAKTSSQNTSSPMLAEGTVTMSKENFQNLVELLRLQMLMSNSSTLGIV